MVRGNRFSQSERETGCTYVCGVGFVVIIIVIRSISSSTVVLVQRSPRASRWWGPRETVCCCCFRVYRGFGFGGQTEDVGDQVAFVKGVVESARDPWW